MTEVVVNLRAGRTADVPAELALSDLAYALQSIRRVPRMTIDQIARVRAMHLDLERITENMERRG